MRLLEFWDSLASHTRALDDDDIVDVMTGRITRDNGVLRSSDVFTFGKVKAPSEAASDDDEGSDAEEGERGEYEVDELDAFGGEEEEDALDVDDGGGLALDVGRLMPPVTPLDPADADDLREFMEAEKRRREICGTDVEGEDAEEEDSEVDEGITDDVRSDIDYSHWRETHGRHRRYRSRRLPSCLSVLPLCEAKLWHHDDIRSAAAASAASAAATPTRDSAAAAVGASLSQQISKPCLSAFSASKSRGWAAGAVGRSQSELPSPFWSSFKKGPTGRLQ